LVDKVAVGSPHDSSTGLEHVPSKADSGLEVLVVLVKHVSIGVSKLSLRYIEEPLIRRGHRYSY